MAKIRASTVQQEREEVYAALQYAASFRCLVDEWHDCERPNPRPKEKWKHVDKNKAKPRYIVCGYEQIPLYEMRKMQQRKCVGPRRMRKNQAHVEKMEKAHMGST